MKDYTFEDFKGLVEKAFHAYKDPMSVPFGMDPFSDQAVTYRNAKREVLNWVLEMMPDGFDIARHSKRLVEQLQRELSVTKKLYAEACQASYDFGCLRAQLVEAREYIEFVEAESEFRKSQLAERDALLRDLQQYGTVDWDRLNTALSASAEPSAANGECEC